jgi:hypothetical protein
MNSWRSLVYLVVLCALLSAAGCDKFAKKPAPTIPPRAQAPTIPTKLPDKIPEVPTEEPPVAVAQDEQPVVEETTPPKTHRRPKKTNAPPTNPPANGQAAPAPGASTAGGPSTVAANHPPEAPAPPDTAIAADVSSATATKQKHSTEELLDAAESKVKTLTSADLSDDQKAMLSQIRSYISQSRKASSDGDLERAYNLAKKAALLSDALAKK